MGSRPRIVHYLIMVLLAGFACGSVAQTLPPHGPLRILVVSDEVNPHSLPPAQLTQPGEISAALAMTPVLNLDSAGDALLEIATDNLADATDLLSRPFGAANAYDVLIYFSHRIPNGAGAQALQENFVTAVNAFLTAGGGVVSFHHGIYFLPGKESVQALLGAQASGAVPWNTTTGQNVINVAPGHFVTSNGVNYAGSVVYADAGFGVPSASYELFNNTPDERYPNLVLMPGDGQITPLFASNYNENGSTHVLGYELNRNNWAGRLVMYQPGEYQPHALAAGNNNYQILLNSIVYVSASAPVPVSLFQDGFESP